MQGEKVDGKVLNKYFIIIALFSHILNWASIDYY